MGMQQLRSIENNTPASAIDVSFNFGTIETFVNNNLVKTDGSSVMIGQLVLAGNPTSDRHAAPKEYVDAIQPVGMIVDFAGAAAPSGWLLCDGTVVNQSEYPALFAVCGATFNTGGEGGTQFRLPDFTDRSSVGTGANAVGTTGGNADVMAHNHTASGGSHSHTSAAHTHDLRSHTHTGAAHVHSIAHDHGAANTASDGDHWHSQLNTYGPDSNMLRNLQHGDPINTLTTAGYAQYKVSVSALGSEHSHSFNMPAFSGNSGPRSASTSGGPSNNSTSNVTPDPTGAVDVTPTISSTGTGADNYHPFLTVAKIIKAG